MKFTIAADGVTTTEVTTTKLPFHEGGWVLQILLKGDPSVHEALAAGMRRRDLLGGGVKDNKDPNSDGYSEIRVIVGQTLPMIDLTRRLGYIVVQTEE